MRRLLLATAVLLASPNLLAQDSAQEQFEKFLAVHRELSRGYSAAQAAVRESEAYKQAVRVGDRERTSALLAAVLEPPTELILRAQEAAAELVGTDGAVPFLSWIVANVRADGYAVRAAADTLVRDHIASDQLIGFARGIGDMTALLGARKVAEIEDALLAQNPDPMIKAHVYNTRARLLDRGDATEAQKKQAVAYYKRAVEFASASNTSAGKSLAEQAAGKVFIAERLQIGMVAPDIEAPDLDGVNFKLSDYRGKVVVIDFWGDW